MTIDSFDSHTAVLLLAHGTPDVLGEMAEYLACVTGGRALPAEVVEELQHRYAQIGLGETPGTEAPPLTRWTLTQAHLLELALEAEGSPLRVYAAMRNWHPFIADVVGQIRADGVRRLIAVCLAPQNSRTSIGLYRRALTAALEADASAPKIELNFVEEWPEQPALIAAFAERLVECCAGIDEEAGLPILFTAHSVPCRTIMTGEASIAGARPGTPMQATPDPYPVEAKRTAELVFEAAARRVPGLTQWYFAFQSQGVAGGPWIGPTVEETLKAIREEGHAGVILQPVGFVCDHVEVLYDIDIAFAETARELGLKLYRPESLNGSLLLTEALLAIVEDRLKAADASVAATSKQR
ncbi:MAG TPA: ferrochelatase [Acidobacteriaceae bacterium]|nr:ferrochelatase [Acidobacteriaceae bacterium]